MDENPLESRTQRDWRVIGAASGIGCTIVVSLLLCIGVGILVDRWLGVQPIGVLAGTALGLVAAGYAMYELTVVGDPERGLVKVRERPQNDNTNG